MIGAWLLVSFSVTAQEKRSAEELAKASDKALELASAGEMEKAVAIWLDLLDEVGPEAAQDINVNLAVAYKQLKRLPEAWYHLARYLKNVSSEDKAAVKELQRIEDALAQTHVKMAVFCDPDGAQVSPSPASGAVSYPCPLTWWFKPGENEVRGRKEGFKDTPWAFTVYKRGGDALVRVTLEKETYGYLVVEGEGRAIQVFIDGSLEGAVPFKRKLKSGGYELMVGAPGKMPWKKKIFIKAGQTVVEKPDIAQKPKPVITKEPDRPVEPVPVKVTEKPAARSSSGWKWALIGSGAGLLTAGAVVQYIGYSKDQSLRDKYPADQSLEQFEFDDNALEYAAAFDSDIKPLRTTSYVLYGAGALAAATGVVLLFLPDRPAEKTSARLLPAATGDGFGFTFEMGF